jgi:Pyruvate/2-oxoacid:ferredoxin oxidoreductase delta subunit
MVGKNKLEGQKTLESGYITLEDLAKAGNIPPQEVLERKAVPIIDDIEEIPCTPCYDVCPTHAIVMPTMNDPPKVNWEACTGCTLCAQACPGLAITIVNMSFGSKVLKRDDLALVSIPYELLPIPARGEKVKVYDRGHNFLCEGEVYSVIKSAKFGTILINVLVPREVALQAKFIEVDRNA